MFVKIDFFIQWHINTCELFFVEDILEEQQ